MIPYKIFENICSIPVKYVIDVLIGTGLNLKISLGKVDLLMMLSLLIHEQGLCFHLFVSSLISFFSMCSFLSTGLLPPCLSLFLGIFSLVAIINGIPPTPVSVSNISMLVYKNDFDF